MFALSDSRLPHFDVKTNPNNLGNEWQKWLRSFRYLVIGQDITSPERISALLLHLAGPDVQEIYDTLDPLPGEEKMNEDEIVVDRLNDYFLPKTNHTFERHIFRSMKQEPEETVDQFLTRLRSQAKRCGFHDPNENVKDQLVDGCRDFNFRRKVLERGDGASLSDVVKLAQTLEITGLQERSYRTAEVNRVSKKTYQAKTKNTKQSNLKCYRCNQAGHFSNSPDCPAREKTCKKCKKRGHFSVCCRTKNQQHSVNHVVEPEITPVEKHRNSEARHYAFSVSPEKGKKIECDVGGVQLSLLVDSGASVNVIDTSTWNALKQQGIECDSFKCDEQIFSYGHEKGLPVIGKFMTTVCHNGKIVEAEFLVFEGTGVPILSLHTANELEVLKIVNAVSKTQDVKDKHSDLFKGIGKLKDFELELHIDESKPPIAQKLRQVPHHLREKIEAALDELLDLDIIEKVEGPTEWVSPIVPVPKKNGELRICVDMRRANEAITRVRHPIPMIDDLLQVIGEGKKFSKIDLRSGFHQIELSEESRKITTFITHKGLFRYKRLMFGVNAAPEIYQHIIGQLIADIPGAVNFIDDLIVFGKDENEHDARLEKLLNRLKEKGLTLNPEKCEFGVPRIQVLGYDVGPNGISVTSEKIKAISEARRPENVSETRSFLGLVQFCGRFIQNLSEIAAPLRELIKKDTEFVWTKRQEEAFLNIKKKLVETEHLTPFKKDAPTILVTDAGPTALGAILLQVSNGEEKVVAYASRSLLDVETRYSQTEKEALSIVWGCEHFYPYIYGTNFELRTDHKPLIFIFSPKSKPSARIERWILRLQPFDFTLKHIEGKTNIADCLSRLTISDDSSSITHKPDEYIYFVASSAVPCAITPKEMEIMSSKDEEFAILRQCIQTEDWKNCPKAYIPSRYELTTLGQLILRGTRIVVPKELRPRIVLLAHEGHQGVVKTKQRLRSKVWWPGMDREAELTCKTCRSCQVVTTTHTHEPLKMTELPDKPWSDLAADLLGPLPGGEYVFVVIDYYSRFFEVDFMRDTTSTKVIESLETMFARFGVPNSIRTDNGPQFISQKFSDFLEENGIQHRRNTPLWPQANGEVERQNRTLLKILKIANLEKKPRSQEVNKFLMAYRNTTHPSTGSTPSKLMFGREMKTKIPELSTDYHNDHAKDTDAENKTRMKDYRDQKVKAKETDFQIGDRVLLRQQKEDKLSTPFRNEEFEVVDRNGTQVTVKSKTGARYTRNTSHVKPIITEGHRNLLDLSHIPDCQLPVHAELPVSVQSDCTPHVIPDPLVPDSTPLMTPVPSEPNSTRPRRARETPRYLDDYMCY